MTGEVSNGRRGRRRRPQPPPHDSRSLPGTAIAARVRDGVRNKMCGPELCADWCSPNFWGFAAGAPTNAPPICWFGTPVTSGCTGATIDADCAGGDRAPSRRLPQAPCRLPCPRLVSRIRLDTARSWRHRLCEGADMMRRALCRDVHGSGRNGTPTSARFLITNETRNGAGNATRVSIAAFCRRRARHAGTALSIPDRPLACLVSRLPQRAAALPVM